jgi:hypothetical protein
MKPDFSPATGVEAQRVWSEVLRPLAVELRGDVRELSLQVVERIRGRFPELFAEPDSFEENRAASEANLRLFCDLVEHGEDPAEVQLPAEAIAYTRETVRRGIPLSAILRSLRLGHAEMTRVLAERLAMRVDVTADLGVATELASAWAFALVDVLSLQAEDAYSLERDRWLRSAAASRAATIDALVEGRDIDAAAASLRLGYELGRSHLAAVAWLDESVEGHDPLAVLEAAVTEFATAIGSGGSLVQPRGLLVADAWLAVADDLAVGAGEDLRLDAATAPGVRLALGGPARGLAGFRASHRQAIQARRVATLMQRRAGTVTSNRRVAISALATHDVEQAREFVAHELGALAADDDVARRLAATLAVYLEEHGSNTRAAKRLGIHENTVRYRIRQAEEMLERPVDERTLDLRVALKLADVVRTAPDDVHSQARG